MKASALLRRHTVIADPPLARFLFSDTRMAIIWLIVRVYVGYSWLDAGWHKVMDVGAKTNYIIDGQGILAFWQRIVAIPAAPARPPITYDWYRGFIQFLIDNHTEVVMGKVVAFGETAVGIGLILGAFVGIAAVRGRIHEPQLHARRQRQHEPGPASAGLPPGVGLEDRGIHRPRSRAAPAAGYPVEGAKASGGPGQTNPQPQPV